MLRSHQCVEIGDITFRVETPNGFKAEEVKSIYWKKGIGKRLVVLLHAYAAKAQSFCHVVRIVNQEMPDTVENPQLDQAKPVLRKQQNLLIASFSRVFYLVWSMLLLTVVWLGQSILTLDVAEWQRTILFMSYLWFIWQILSCV